MGHISHWDEVDVVEATAGPVGGRYQDLGEAAGSVEIGLGRFRPPPGNQTTPAHVEGGEEEISYILAGSGWSWQDGKTYAVSAGDVLVHRREEEAHTLVAGDDRLDVLAFGERAYPGATHLVRAGVVRIVDTWVEALGPPHPYEREAAAGRVELGEPSPRPDRIVAVADVEARRVQRNRTDMLARDLGRTVGSVTTGMRHLELAPGSESYPLHCHSAEEELLVVIDGSGVVVLGDEEHPVRAGSVVARPAGTGVAHGFVAGDAGLTVLAYGQRDARDVAFYPRSRVVSIRGLGVKFRVDGTADQWDVEAG